MPAASVPTDTGVLSAVGNTPLVALTRLLGHSRFRLFAKLEGLNPGGSMKDRPAAAILRGALEAGTIGRNTAVVESSSGNLAVGLAQACAYHGLRFISVVDPKASQQNLAILRAYGAEIEMVSAPDPETGEYLPALLARVQELLCQIDNAFWPNQYANLDNPRAHHATVREILDKLDGRLDFLFCAVSTCGLLRGCAEYLREHRLGTKVVAVDAVGSVIFGRRPGRRLLPGHGAAVRPALFRGDLHDEVLHVSDLDCVVGCRRLVRSEAILAGGSSGAVVTAVSRLQSAVPDGAACVAVLPDRGERYLDTVYSDAWVSQHFGDVSHLWSEAGGVVPCATTTSRS